MGLRYLLCWMMKLERYLIGILEGVRNRLSILRVKNWWLLGKVGLVIYKKFKMKVKMTLF